MQAPSEELLQAALASHFDWSKNQCFPSIQMWEWEQDFVVVTPAGRVWEVEIKISASDWTADKKKDKWESQNWKKVARFYYCVSAELLNKGVPEWIPAYVGLLSARMHEGRWRITEVRPASTKSTFKISQMWMHRMYRSTYFRFWRSRKHDPMHDQFVLTSEDQSLALELSS